MIFIHMILLNLLTLVIITQFETLHKNPLNPELIFVNNVDYFKKAWSKFSASHNNEKISRTKLPEFFRFLGAPLGIDRFDNFFDEAKKIMKMEIRCDLEGFVNFHSLLHATMKNFFNEKLGLENAHVDSLKKLEIYENHFHIAVLKKIKVNKTRIQAFKERFTFKEKENNFVSINPFKDYFNLLLCFLSMKKFAVIDNPKNLQNKNPINKSRNNKLFYFFHIIILGFYQNSYSSEIDFFSKMSPSKLFEKTNSNLIANTSSKISKKN